MGAEGVVALLGIAVVIGLFALVLAGGRDLERIRRYIESRGGKLIKAHRKPPGPGYWAVEPGGIRTYEIRYLDGSGHEHRARCQTNETDGVFLSDDTIVRYAGQRPGPPG